MDRPNIAVVSGGFDPVHEGHISLIDEASRLTNSQFDSVIVGLNSDEWLINKKGYFFMSYSEREAVMKSIKNVTEVVSFDDSDGTAVDLLEKIKKQYINHNIIFMNGGDRNKKNSPERNVSGIDHRFGIGGSHKANSSSDILSRFIDNIKNDVVYWRSVSS
jgi:cytidyltransferase-like protein